MLPDLPAVARTFDYTVPAAWAADGRARDVRVGTRVRIPFHGRRIGGWVVALDVEPPADVDLADLTGLSGWGPAADVIDLAHWIAAEWVAPVAKVLRTASPGRNVHRLPAATVTRLDDGQAEPEWVRRAFAGGGATVRIAPASDRWPLMLGALRRGNPLFIVPSVETVDALTRRLQSLRIPVAAMPDHWARARAGAAVVGTRTAVLAPGVDVGAIVVLDEHDDALAEERTPTWHAREVAVERARRLGVPCVLVSPTPTVEATLDRPLVEQSRRAEHAGWATIETVDRRDEPPGRTSLFSDRLVTEIRAGRRVAMVLNRRGRARMLACATCGELARCVACDALVRQDDREASTLSCQRCREERPPVCASCGALKLRNIRMGVTRAREELEALAREPVAELTASGWSGDDTSRLVIGTEALLHRTARWETVVFLDFDQELMAVGQAAATRAIGLLARASRSVGARAGGGRVIVQTRAPEHPVIEAARTAQPAAVTVAERDLRQRMGWHPFGAQAVISGAGAATFVASMGEPLGLEVRGPADERWMVRGPDRTTLAAALGQVKRPDARLRIEINPSRL